MGLVFCLKAALVRFDETNISSQRCRLNAKGHASLIVFFFFVGRVPESSLFNLIIPTLVNHILFLLYSHLLRCSLQSSFYVYFYFIHYPLNVVNIFFLLFFFCFFECSLVPNIQELLSLIWWWGWITNFSRFGRN